MPPLPAEVAESLQASHEDAVAFAKAQAAVDAARADAASDAAAAALEPPELFVKRGGRHYTRAATARLKPAERFLSDNPTAVLNLSAKPTAKANFPNPQSQSHETIPTFPTPGWPGAD